MSGGPRPGWRIDDVLARTDLAALLDDLAEPAMFATRGRRWHCPLPEHDDHHASVTIHTDHRGHERWRCWSGDNNHRGDAVDLVRVTQGVPRVEALDWLASRAGMIPDRPLPAVAVRAPTIRAATVEVPLDPSVTRYVEACERVSKSARTHCLRPNQAVLTQPAKYRLTTATAADIVRWKDNYE